MNEDADPTVKQSSMTEMLSRSRSGSSDDALGTSKSNMQANERSTNCSYGKASNS